MFEWVMVLEIGEKDIIKSMGSDQYFQTLSPPTTFSFFDFT